MNSEIIKDLHQGKEHALRKIFDLYANDVYRVALTILKDDEESQDIVQEVFIKLWNYRENLDPNSEIWAFLYVVTKRTSLNTLRNKRELKIKESLISEVTPNFCSSDIFTIKQEVDRLEKQIMEMLPDQQKRAYRLSRIEGLSHKEIAIEMEISPNTVKNHIVQALKTFKKYFQKYGYPILIFFLD